MVSHTYRKRNGKRQHRDSFYKQLDDMWEKKDSSTSLLTEDKWKKIMEACEINKKPSPEEFKTLAREEGYTQAFKWRSKFDVIIFGESKTLVYSQPPTPDGTFPPLESYKQPSHYGRIFDDIHAIHTTGNDHPKGRTLVDRVKKKHGPSIPNNVCKLFTDTCPHCIETMKRRKPTAGHQPILTKGLGVRGQVDLILTRPVHPTGPPEEDVNI
jgi:hypothetical protein